MKAVVEQVGRTSEKQSHWSVRVKIGSVVLEALNHYTFYKEGDAQDFADKVNKEIAKELGEPYDKNTLIISHDKYFAKNVQAIIENDKNKCDTCSNTDKFLDIWNDIDKYDIIILGLMMLESERFKKVKSHYDQTLETGEIMYNRIIGKYPKKKIIITTVKNLDDLKIKFTRDTYYIQKPLTERKFRTLLRLL